MLASLVLGPAAAGAVGRRAVLPGAATLDVREVIHLLNENRDGVAALAGLVTALAPDGGCRCGGRAAHLA